MNTDSAPATKETGFFGRALSIYQKETGQSLILWALIALLNFIAQIVFHRELAPGEFGTLNTALGMIGLMIVPVLALNQAFAHYLASAPVAGSDARVDSLRAAALPATETFAWIWGALCLVLVFLLLPLLDLPRFSLQLFTLMNVLIAIGGLVSWAVCRDGNQLRLWAWLLVSSALARVLAGAGLAWQAPWAESGLAAFLVAGFITLTPALRSRETSTATRLKACQAVWDRDFLLCAGATFSVLLALCLFSSADRIVAQSWFGVAMNNNMGMVNWDLFDAYQTAGLLARGLLWGTQPLLWILFAQRSRLDRTRADSLTFFWIYLGTLLAGVVFLFLLAGPLSRLFCRDTLAMFARPVPTSDLTAHFVPSLAAAMIPLGVLQALGIFSLASRRYPECFVLGGCSVGYTLLLYVAGRQPQLMPVYMFGGGLVCLMMVLFVGVVRWGRKQP
jgi:hypothetical protein